MTRYERKRFFEQLMALRDAYRAETHAATDLTVDGAVTFAEHAFNAAVAADLAWVETAAAPRATTAKANPAAF